MHETLHIGHRLETPSTVGETTPIQFNTTLARKVLLCKFVCYLFKWKDVYLSNQIPPEYLLMTFIPQRVTEMNMWPSQLNRNLSSCEVAPQKSLSRLQWDSNLWPLRSRTAVLYQLSYEDPYTESRPIYWFHQPTKGMKHRMKWCEVPSTAMVTYSFHLYSCSSHHFIQRVNFFADYTLKFVTINHYYFYLWIILR